MSFTKFSRVDSVKHDHEPNPAITFNKSGGGVRLNTTLAELFNYQPVSFYQSETDPKEWFIFKDPEEGFKSRRQGYGKGFVFRCVGFHRHFLRSCKIFENGTFKFLVSAEPIEKNGVQLYPIITLSAKNVSLDKQ